MDKVVGLVVAVALAGAVMAWAGPRVLNRASEAEPVAVAPLEAPAATQTDASVSRSPDGHYWAEATIEGRAIRLMVDTGASAVALTRADARRLGLTPRPADFTVTVRTASGEVRAAPVTLRSVSVAGARVEQVEALVVEEGLDVSLLGMSYLGRLSRFEATPRALILRR